MVSAAPPLTGSKVTVAPFLALATPVTLAPSLNSKPCLDSRRWNCLETSPSMPPRMVSRNSTTVTLAPSRAQTEPSSSPMTPPPTTTRWPGTFSSDSAPVDDTMTFSSMSTLTPGMPATSEPVAMTMFLVSISSTLPSSPVTDTLPAATTLPVPRKLSILFFLNRKATPLTLDATVASLCAIIFFRLSFGAVSRRRACRRNGRPRRTSRRRRAAPWTGCSRC